MNVRFDTHLNSKKKKLQKIDTSHKLILLFILSVLSLGCCLSAMYCTLFHINSHIVEVEVKMSHFLSSFADSVHCEFQTVSNQYIFRPTEKFDKEKDGKKRLKLYELVNSSAFKRNGSANGTLYQYTQSKWGYDKVVILPPCASQMYKNVSIAFPYNDYHNSLTNMMRYWWKWGSYYIFCLLGLAVFFTFARFFAIQSSGLKSIAIVFVGLSTLASFTLLLEGLIVYNQSPFSNPVYSWPMWLNIASIFCVVLTEIINGCMK